MKKSLIFTIVLLTLGLSTCGLVQTGGYLHPGGSIGYNDGSSGMLLRGGGIFNSDGTAGMVSPGGHITYSDGTVRLHLP